MTSYSAFVEGSAAEGERQANLGHLLVRCRVQQYDQMGPIKPYSSATSRAHTSNNP